MATRSKGHNFLRRALCAVMVIIGASVLTASAFTQYQTGIENSQRALYNEEWFLNCLARGMYTLNWRAQQQWLGEDIQPNELYCKVEEDEKKDEETDLAQRSEVDRVIHEGEMIVDGELDGMDWQVADTQGNRYSNLKIDLSDFWQNGQITDEGKDRYQYFLVLQFDESGKLKSQGFYGGDRVYAEATHQNELWRFRQGEYDLKRLIAQDTSLEVSYDDQGATVTADILQPTGITIYYAIPRVVDVDSGIYQSLYYADGNAFVDAGFGTILTLVSGILVAGVILICVSPKLRAAEDGIRGSSFELSVIGLLLVLVGVSGCIQFSLFVARGDFARWLSIFLEDAQTIAWLNILVLFAANLLMLGCMAGCSAGFSGIFALGPRRYFSKCSWIGRKIGAFWRWSTRLDFTESGTKTLLRFLLANFLILSICCSAWFFGVFGLLVYSIVLFAVLHKKYEKIRHDYSVLVAATEKMAQGDLETDISEDVGIFNPLREQLSKVQVGFKQAVETELKSRSLKTELITNVSHDLKTPLTAIITYVDLLKDETLDAQVRREYVQTLERKTQRLKQLIEDLFEISKAASGNVNFTYERVDLVQLIKQVGCELEDKITASGIDFRWNLPDQPVFLQLDGQRSYRIFENLIVNITKYGLAHTRAYVSLFAEEDTVVVTLKNVSAQELDFDPQEITERFTRGDRSRNTEGSGLGLAIAKSFTEQQGGRFEILLDGDLFTARLSWPKQETENY